MPCHPKLYRLLLASASGYASTYNELVETTDWSRYGRGRDPRCANRMAHCGYEPTAVLATIGLAEGLGKIKEAQMACTGACDKASTCDCRGQRGTRAARSELDDVRAQVTRLEAELADRKPAGS